MNENLKDSFSDVDKVKIGKIKQRIIIEEVNNLKQRGIDNASMVRKIQKIIEEEVQCYSGN